MVSSDNQTKIQDPALKYTIEFTEQENGADQTLSVNFQADVQHLFTDLEKIEDSYRNMNHKYSIGAKIVGYQKVDYFFFDNLDTERDIFTVTSTIDLLATFFDIQEDDNDVPHICIQKYCKRTLASNDDRLYDEKFFDIFVPDYPALRKALE